MRNESAVNISQRRAKEHTKKTRHTSLFLRRDNLVLLPHSDGVHPRVPTTTHDVTGLFKLFNLFRSETDLSSSGDTLAVGHERSHGGTLSRSEMTSEASGRES